MEMFEVMERKKKAQSFLSKLSSQNTNDGAFPTFNPYRTKLELEKWFSDSKYCASLQLSSDINILVMRQASYSCSPRALSFPSLVPSSFNLQECIQGIVLPVCPLQACPQRAHHSISNSVGLSER